GSSNSSRSSQTFVSSTRRSGGESVIRQPDRASNDGELGCHAALRPAERPLARRSTGGRLRAAQHTLQAPEYLPHQPPQLRQQPCRQQQEQQQQRQERPRVLPRQP